jgi:hypothetical protein
MPSSSTPCIAVGRRRHEARATQLSGGQIAGEDLG